MRDIVILKIFKFYTFPYARRLEPPPLYSLYLELCLMAVQFLLNTSDDCFISHKF